MVEGAVSQHRGRGRAVVEIHACRARDRERRGARWVDDQRVPRVQRLDGRGKHSAIERTRLRPNNPPPPTASVCVCVCVLRQELTARTGRSPRYVYLQIGCSKNQEVAMLNFARSCVGKPFSNSGMARSLFWPRKTDGSSFFCAELVAAVLKRGGLLDEISNPGAATPEGLHELYKQRATTTANPYLLRQANCRQNLTTSSVVQQRLYKPPPLPSPGAFARARSAPPQRWLPPQLDCAAAPTSGRSGALKVLSAGVSVREPQHQAVPLGLTLHSLTFRR